MLLAKLRSPLVRVGAGLMAMGFLAIGLWPTVEVQFDPEKALAFFAALSAWLFAEIYTEVATSDGSIEASRDELSDHDRDFAQRLIGTVDGNFVRFLKSHDFGASWLKTSLDPAYDLEHLLEDTNSAFSHEELSGALLRVKKSNRALVEKTAMYGGPVSGSGVELFDMIPTMEKRSGVRSERTESKIAETNAAAEQLADDLAELFAQLRNEGLSLMK